MSDDLQNDVILLTRLFFFEEKRLVLKNIQKHMNMTKGIKLQSITMGIYFQR